MNTINTNIDLGFWKSRAQKIQSTFFNSRLMQRLLDKHTLIVISDDGSSSLCIDGGVPLVKHVKDSDYINRLYEVARKTFFSPPYAATVWSKINRRDEPPCLVDLGHTMFQVNGEEIVVSGVQGRLKDLGSLGKKVYVLVIPLGVTDKSFVFSVFFIEEVYGLDLIKTQKLLTQVTSFIKDIENPDPKKRDFSYVYSRISRENRHVKDGSLARLLKLNQGSFSNKKRGAKGRNEEKAFTESEKQKITDYLIRLSLESKPVTGLDDLKRCL